MWRQDSGAAKCLNLCRATKPPAGCHAVVRSIARRAPRDPRPTPGRRYALQAALRSAVRHSCRRHRRQFLPLYRDLHRSASPPAEHRLRSALEARARPYRHPLHPSGPQSTGRRAGVPPPRRRSAERWHRSVATHHITGWENTQAKLRQFHRPQSGPIAARIRYRSRPGFGAHRYRRKVQRDPRRAADAW